jgi:hypothetical protein
MKTKSIQQEILLLTGSHFATKEWAEKNVQEKSKLSAIEKLEDACWNGLLDEMLPGMIEKTAKGKKLFLHNIRECESFLEIDLSESSIEIEGQHSIDPYYFVPTIVLS